jgi:hypothetical protein
MKRYLTLLFLVTVMASLSYAQQRSGGFRRLQLDDNTGSPVYLTNASGSVGINTLSAAPNTCALLDLSSTSKGILIPRMNGAQVAALCQTPGMLAYNISTNTFDYWNGAAWTTLSSNSDWMLSGNTLTGVEWFGSANAFDVVFKANSVEAMRIASTGQLGIGTAPTGRLVAIGDATNVGNFAGSFANSLANQYVGLSSGKEVTSAAFFNGPYALAGETNVTVSNTSQEIGTMFAWGRTSGSADANLDYALLARNDNTSASTINTMASVESFLGVNSGTISNYSGYFMQQLQNSGTITNCYGLNISGFNNAGTLTNTYGVFIGDITSGTQTNQAYSFYASDANARSYFNGNNGFGVSSAPNTTVDVGGSFAIRRNGVFNLGAGSFDLGIGTGTGFYDVAAAAGGSSVRGLTNGADGRIIYLYSTGTGNLTIVNEDGGTTAADRIHTMKGANQTVTGEAMITLIYNTNISRWLVVSVQD